MLRAAATGLLVLGLGATPAAAANIAGWYAGIYAGTASRNDARLSYDFFGATLDGPGPVETPASFVNDGIDPFLFEGLNLGVLEFPFASGLPGFGAAGGTLVDAMLSFARAGTGGGVVGYGFGNGVRVEADISAMRFAAGLLTETAATGVVVGGGLDGSGNWIWSELFSAPGALIDTPYSLEDDSLIYRSDVQFLLVGGYYDLETSTPVMPYLGAGLGLARVNATVTDTCTCGGGTHSASAIVPAAQLGGGLRIAIADPVSIDLGYRLRLAASPDVSVYSIETAPLSFPAFSGIGLTQSGAIAVHALQAGLTVALQ